MTETKPCPFCGGKAKLETKYSERKNKYYTNVKCSNCYVQTRTFASDEESNEAVMRCAINAWNLRYNG